MPSQLVYRLFLGVLVLASALTLLFASGTVQGLGIAPADGTGTDSLERQVPIRSGMTVIATDSNVWLADEGSGPRQSSELLAYAANGSLAYANGSHDRYWDVDPSPRGDRTVLYVASDHLGGGECCATTVCTRNVVERVNLTTGDVTRLYERLTPHKHATRWHDVDRLDDSRLVVADIYRDGLFVVNTTTGIVEWEWSAQQAFDPSSGGPFPRDWTHINDVEALEDGRFMVSVRNQDQVLFVDPSRGVVSNWTLGADNRNQILHQQHNPDYVPPDRGGPAVLVADSENNRVVEYQRTADGVAPGSTNATSTNGSSGNATSTNGSTANATSANSSGETWNRTWVWQDPRIQWPRDADRLPNGNTLVTDSNGGRVFEVAPDGAVVWSVDVAFPYEAERLGTGDESTGGPAAATFDPQSRSAGVDPSGDRPGVVTQGWLVIKDVMPGPLLNGIVYVLPGWFGPLSAVALPALVVGVVTWSVLEWRWSTYGLDVSRPVRLTRRER